MTPLQAERREPARNWLRFYAITVTRTLFDGWAVVREWGRIGQPGTVRETWFETETAAVEVGEKVRQRKEKRGYRAVGGFSKAGEGEGEGEGTGDNRDCGNANIHETTKGIIKDEGCYCKVARATRYHRHKECDR